MNAQDVLNRARTEGVELIRFIYCDFTGVQRGKVTAIDDLANRLSHGINLTTAQMAFTLINTIIPIEGMSPVGELRLVPDPETFTILPWMPEHASMNCDLIQKNGERYGACPRTFLKDVIKRAADCGVRVQAAFEDEFYLCKQHPETGTWEPADDSGIYHETGFDYQGTFHTTMVRTLRSMGMMPEMVYHEGGPGQQEISIRHEHALKAADNQMKLRNAVRGVAHTMGYRASFAPKPFPWTFGNGAHVHMSIWDMETNTNLMYDAGAEEQFSQMGRSFVGGLLTHMPALVALTCPSYNSYRRLQPRSWSTSDVVWGFDNRQAAVRAASPFWGREMATSNIEIKASDSTSNPYIALAGMIAAGLDGIDNKIDPGEPTQIDPADYSDAERKRRGIRRVPTSLREAIGELKANPLFKELMPELMWHAYQEVKLAECDAFEAHDEEFELKAHFDVF
jgi:glutamine synthetase